MYVASAGMDDALHVAARRPAAGLVVAFAAGRWTIFSAIVAEAVPRSKRGPKELCEFPTDKNTRQPDYYHPRGGYLDSPQKLRVVHRIPPWMMLSLRGHRGPSGTLAIAIPRRDDSSVPLSSEIPRFAHSKYSS
jgi:hypothetical protein